VSKTKTVLTITGSIVGLVIAVGGVIWGMEKHYAKADAVIPKHVLDDSYDSKDEFIELAGSVRDFRYQQRIDSSEDKLRDLQIKTGKRDCGNLKEYCDDIIRNIERTKKEMRQPYFGYQKRKSPRR